MRKDRTLLIVDDEVDVCVLLRRSFQQEFNRIECAYSLTDALVMARMVWPDVLLLDNNLPDGHGIDHIGYFKALDPNLQIIVISAMDLQAEALAAGADVFVSKPLGMDDIRKAMFAN